MSNELNERRVSFFFRNNNSPVSVSVANALKTSLSTPPGDLDFPTPTPSDLFVSRYKPRYKRQDFNKGSLNEVLFPEEHNYTLDTDDK